MQEQPDNPLNLTDEEIGDLNAWLTFDDEASVRYAAPKVCKLIRAAMQRDGYL